MKQPFVVPVLVYHSVSDRSSAEFRRYTVTPEQFREHVAYLAESGYRPLTIPELAKLARSTAAEPEERYVALTFDDAFQDFGEHALPALQDAGLTATLYVPTGFVGGTSRWLAREGEDRRPMMSWDEIGAAAASGIECGAHSHTHPELDRLQSEALEAETLRPRRMLEEKLGRPVRSFAYPFGFHSRRARAAVARAGYASACAVGNVIATDRSDPLAIPRLTVEHGTDVERLRRLLVSPPRRRARLVSEAKRHVWQARRQWLPAG